MVEPQIPLPLSASWPVQSCAIKQGSCLHWPAVQEETSEHYQAVYQFPCLTGPLYSRVTSWDCNPSSETDFSLQYDMSPTGRPPLCVCTASSCDILMLYILVCSVARPASHVSASSSSSTAPKSSSKACVQETCQVKSIRLLGKEVKGWGLPSAILDIF